MTSESPLNDLLVDEEEINESLLTEVLAPYVQIGKKSGSFIPTDKFDSLDSTKQTAIVLLFQQAASELGLVEQNGGTPSEISESSGLNHNTVKTAVRKLEERDLALNDNGTYSIPQYNYDTVKKFIQNE